MKQHIEELIRSALKKLEQNQQIIGSTPSIQIESTKDKKHGDFASNIALVLAKENQCRPRELAELIRNALPSSNQILKTEIAGPGFINFFLEKDALSNIIPQIISAGKNYGRSNVGAGKKVLIEFVSTNPNGPLHVGHGRHAAYGAVVSDLLQTIGFTVHREYYVNDAGRQMDILTVSVWLRYLALFTEKITFPANAYKGNYVIEIAKKLKNNDAEKYIKAKEKIFSDLPLDEPDGGDKEIYIDALIVRAKELLGSDYLTVFDFSLETILEDIRDDLSEFGVEFDHWFSERSFTKKDVVQRMIKILQEKNLTYEKDSALWFRSTTLGDEKDRVLLRSNGQATYFANDLAYHINKFERGFDFAIDVFGSDHHGYVPRMKAGLKAFAIPDDKLTYLLLQFVTLFRDNKQVQMSTRSGSFVTLRELRNEVGNDAARFFYVMRKFEQHIDFDLNLAKTQSNENPVYYIQYAHARICSVFRQLAEKNMQYDEENGIKNLRLLTEPQELQLLNTLSRYNEIILNAARLYEPSLLTHYLRELANDFHGYYNAHQFLVEDVLLRNARLTLITATRQVIKNGLKLLGVSRPESM